MELDHSGNLEYIKKILIDFKTNPPPTHPVNDIKKSDENRKQDIFNYLKKYLKFTTIGFGLVVFLSFFRFSFNNFSFGIDDWALRIIATIFPTQAVALVYLIVRHYYPNHDKKLHSENS